MVLRVAKRTLARLAASSTKITNDFRGTLVVLVLASHRIAISLPQVEQALPSSSCRPSVWHPPFRPVPARSPRTTTAFRSRGTTAFPPSRGAPPPTYWCREIGTRGSGAGRSRSRSRPARSWPPPRRKVRLHFGIPCVRTRLSQRRDVVDVKHEEETNKLIAAAGRK
jgi:hypothetical protein